MLPLSVPGSNSASALPTAAPHVRCQPTVPTWWRPAAQVRPSHPIPSQAVGTWRQGTHLHWAPPSQSQYVVHTVPAVSPRGGLAHPRASPVSRDAPPQPFSFGEELPPFRLYSAHWTALPAVLAYKDRAGHTAEPGWLAYVNESGTQRSTLHSEPIHLLMMLSSSFFFLSLLPCPMGFSLFVVLLSLLFSYFLFFLLLSCCSLPPKGGCLSFPRSPGGHADCQASRH